MSWLSKLAKIGKIAVGIGLGAVTGGAGAAVLGGVGGAVGVAGKGGGSKDWLGPVVSSGIEAGANIYGARLQAGANKQATAAQAAASDRALAFEQRKYADVMQRVSPWVSSGQGAAGQMGALLRPQASAQAPAQTAGVSLRAPDGTVATVPADQVDHFLQRGATRVS